MRYTCVSGNPFVASLGSETVNGIEYERLNEREYIREVHSLILTVDDDNNSVREVALARSLLDELQTSTIVCRREGWHRLPQADLNAIVRQIVPLMIRHATVLNCETWLRDWEVRIVEVLVPCTYRERRPAMLLERRVECETKE